MTEFKALDELFDDTLRLPIGGKVYIIPAPDAQLGLYCQRLLAAGKNHALGRETSARLDDEEELDLYTRCLGTAYSEMVADGVSWTKIRHAGMTALIWIGSGDELAEAWWSRPQGEAPPPANRAARRASNSTAVENTTPRQASTSGTKSRMRSGGVKAAKA